MPSNSMTALSVVEFLFIVAPIICEDSVVYLLFSTLCPNFAIIEASITTESRAKIWYQ